MGVCIHGNLCRDILKKSGFIYCRNCPIGCPYFEEKYKPVSPADKMKLKRVEILLESDEEV